MTAPITFAAPGPGKLNLALWGPSGAGKTYTALALAHQLGRRVAVIDTEHGASRLYGARFPADIAVLDPPYAPERFTEALTAAAAGGYDVVVVDSLSPEWDGPGGCLELVAAARSAIAGWRAVTPRHEALLGAINRSPCSVITTFREKPRLVLDAAAPAKADRVRWGPPTPVTRAHFEYEYDLVLQLDREHRYTITKSRILGLAPGPRPVDAALLAAIREARRGGRPAEVTADGRD